MLEEHEEVSPESSPIDLELYLSDSESSPDTIINTSLEVLDGDDIDRDLELFQDDVIAGN